MVGVVSIHAALEAADEAGLDLVEVSPNADPPVCKLLDYGRFKYEAQYDVGLYSSFLAACKAEASKNPHGTYFALGLVGSPHIPL